jgi:hypothetical protein
VPIAISLFLLTLGLGRLNIYLNKPTVIKSNIKAGHIKKIYKEIIKIKNEIKFYQKIKLMLYCIH